MFQTHADAIVNTVNCVGVMGKGVALQFKQRWPENFKAYKAACLKKNVQPGKMFVFNNGDMFSTQDYKYLINFPTKNHWRAKSKIEDVQDGLIDLAAVIKFHDIKSICIPPLGCGNGGLDWAIVRPLIETALLEESLSRNIFLFGPKTEADIPEYAPIELSMTYPRALLFKALGEFESYFGGGFTKISLQKIVYFLQILKVDFGLRFSKNIYGPYSSTLAKALINIGEAKGLLDVDESSETVKVSAIAYSQASDFFEASPSGPADKVLEQLAQLISGFESSYGLELLSSVHYLAESHRTTDLDCITTELHDWSDRKCKLFPKEVVSNALERLIEDRIILQHQN